MRTQPFARQFVYACGGVRRERSFDRGKNQPHGKKAVETSACRAGFRLFGGGSGCARRTRRAPFRRKRRRSRAGRADFACAGGKRRSNGDRSSVAVRQRFVRRVGKGDAYLQRKADGKFGKRKASGNGRRISVGEKIRGAFGRADLRRRGNPRNGGRKAANRTPHFAGREKIRHRKKGYDFRSARHGGQRGDRRAARYVERVNPFARRIGR